MRTERVPTASGAYTIHVDGEDPGKPFAVFLHGGPGFHSHGERSQLGGRFRDEVNFLWFDLLGCGEFQAAPGCVVDWDRQVEDVIQVIRHFTRDPVHLVGHCLATETIHDLIRRSRDIARSVLWFSPLRSVGGCLRTVIRRCIAEGLLDARSLSSAITARLDRFFAVPEAELGADDALLILQIASASPDFHRLYWLDSQAMSRWEAWMAEQPMSPETFLRLTSQLFERGVLPLPDYGAIPAHIVYSHDDRITTWELHGQQLLHHIPHATTTEVGGGHWVQFERPGECARAALEFFARNP